jgi:integrase/recombinase XerD
MSLTTSAPPAYTRADSDAKLVELWLERQNSDGGRAAYRRVAASFLARFPNGLRSVTLEDMLAFKDANAYGSLAAQRTRLSTVKSLLTFAHEVGYVPFNVGRAVKTPPAQSAVVERILSEADIVRLVDAGSLPWHRLVMKLIYIAGVRLSEVIGLERRHVITRDGGAQITVIGKGQKQRVILLPRETSAELLAFVDGLPETALVFPGMDGKHLHPNSIGYIVKNAARRAGLPRSVSTHWLRHSHASHAHDRGAPVGLIKETLGHSSVATTSVYLHARPDDSSSKYLAME